MLGASPLCSQMIIFCILLVCAVVTVKLPNIKHKAHTYFTFFLKILDRTNTTKTKPSDTRQKLQNTRQSIDRLDEACKIRNNPPTILNKTSKYQTRH